MEKPKIFVGKKNGPVSIVVGGIHGNETCGINAILKILPNFVIDRGTVIFVFGNPKAIALNKRFVTYNLNRLFGQESSYDEKIKKSYEYKRAQYLKTIFDQADAMLDIHSTTNKSKPFIICEKNADKIVKYFPKNFVRKVSGFGGVEPGATDDYMSSRGKIGITIECGQHNDGNAEKIAIKSIKAFLEILGHIKKTKRPPIKRTAVHMMRLYHTKTNSFKLAKVMDDFYEAKKDELIGVDGKEEIRTDEKCLVVFAHNINKKDEEAFLIGKKIGKTK